MYLFWIIIFCFTLIALGFVLKPLITKSACENFDANLNPTTSPFMALFLMIAIPFVSISLYLFLGNSKEVAENITAAKNSSQVKQEIARFGSRQNIILALRNKLQQLPRNESSAKGWYLLGKLYFNEKNFVEAINAFQTAVDLKSNDPEYILQLASTKLLVNHQLTNEDKKLVEKLLVIYPNNVNAINLLALDAYQQKNYVIAIRYWESLLKYFPTDSADSKALLEMIQLAQNQLPENTKMGAKPISVAVNILPNLKEKINPSDSLFVYALELGGNKIPLAVKRIAASTLPVNVSLATNQGMIPGRTIANAEKFFIEARISKTGDALPKKGDFVGKSIIINRKQNQNIKIIIDRVL